MAARFQGCHPMGGTRAQPCSSFSKPSSAAFNFSTMSKALPTLHVNQSSQQRISHQATRIIVMAAANSETPSGLQGLAETAALDELIDILLSATDANDLTQKVAENMLSFDQRFWLRLATRTDSAAEPEDRERLASLAKVVMQLVDAMVRKTNSQLTDSAGVLQEILKAAADERTGEWKLPLPADKVAAMRAAMDARAEFIDEALLSNCFAWMRKASDDNLDGMVVILQKVLQLYASRALSIGDAATSSGSSSSPAESTLSELLKADEGTWAPIIRKKAQDGEISEVSFLEALQRKMECVVLGLSSGSYSQRVQAEYLKELESRSKEVFADLAAGK
jgi:hypothetical protein